MDFKTTHTAILACLQAGAPVLLQSDPGTGKTAYGRSLAEAANRHFELVIPSVCDPTDIGGIPYNHDGNMLISIPWFVQRCQRVFAETGQASLVLWDEITNASRGVMGAMLSGLQTGVFGSGKLPVGTWQLMACNPPETAADGNDLPAPFANRTYHFDWKPTTNEWVKGMLAGFPEPDFIPVGPNWEAGIAKWRSLIASYLQYKPGSAYVLPDEEAKRSGPWPSYRSWDVLVANGLAALDSMTGIQAPRDVQLTIVAAAIGGTHGVAFLTWIDTLDLPNPETLLKNPGSFEPNVRGDINFTALTSVAQVVAENLTADRYIQGWAVMEVAAKKGLTAEATTAARVLARLREKDPKLPIPSKQLAPFVAVLRKYGLLKDGK